MRQEWGRLFGQVTGLLEAYRKRAEREKAELALAPAPVREPRPSSIGAWEDWPRYRSDDDNGCRAINMADNVEERRRRYGIGENR